MTDDRQPPPATVTVQAAPMGGICPRCGRDEETALFDTYRRPVCVPCALRGAQRAAFIYRNANRLIEAVRRKIESK